MAHEKNHDYHILTPSIWPLFGGLSALTMLVGAVFAAHHLGRGSRPNSTGRYSTITMAVYYWLYYDIIHNVCMVERMRI